MAGEPLGESGDHVHDLRRCSALVTGPLEAIVTDDIDQIPPAMWDALLDDDDLQASHRFVRSCQRSGVEEAEYRHILLSRGGRTVATATLARMDVRVELLAGPGLQRPVTAARRLFPRLLRVPVILGGLPVSFGQSCLRVAPGEDASPLLARFADEADRFAESAGAGFICFKEMSSKEAEVADGLGDLGYFRVPSLPSCHLELPFCDMKGFGDAMRSGYRRQLRHTERELQDSHLTVRVIDDWESLEGTLFELYEQVMDRAEYQLERLNAAFFRELRMAFGDQARVLTVESEGGDVLAFALMLHGEQRSTFLIAGIRYEAPGALAAYRSVVTETIADALKHGASALEMGQTSYGIKTRLGAQPTVRHLYLRHRGPLVHRLMRGLGGVLFPDHVVPPRRVFRRAEH
jgi:hypothetical protein